MANRRVFIHYAEIGLKGGNRSRFVRRLADRLREALQAAGVRCQVRRSESRLAITPPAEASLDRVVDVVRRVPGVAHVLPGVAVDPAIASIEEASVAVMQELPPGTFKVESRRSDKQYPLDSIAISRRIAAVVHERTERVARVRGPDHVLRIHVGAKEAWVGAARVAGPGGLPVGSARPLLGFLSGGLDSPVALWKMMRRGAEVIGVHFHNRTVQGRAVREKIEDLCAVLAWSCGGMPLRVVPFEGCQRAIVAAVPAEFRMIVYRRAMFRIAAAIAFKENAYGYVTGDSLGQVASQTSENLRSILAVADLPVYTPLIGSDKAEIMARARTVGTYDISNRPHEDCCSFMIAPHPATSSHPAQIAELEAELDWEALVAEAVAITESMTVAPDPALLA